MLNFGVTLGWPISQKQTSKNNHLFLENTYLMSQISQAVNMLQRFSMKQTLVF